MTPLFILAATEINPYVSVVLQHLLPVVASLVLIGAVPLVRHLVKLFEKKTGLDIAAQHEELLEQALTRSVGLGEEWARKQIQGGAQKPPGAEKLDKALLFAEEELGRLGVPEKSKEALTKLIEARLGIVR